MTFLNAQTKFLFLLGISVALISGGLFAEEKRWPAYNTLAVDIPFDGGAMLSYTRSWRVRRYIDIGWVVAGGQIQREFTLKSSNGGDTEVETEAWVYPLTGPIVTLHNDWAGISLGVAGFFANTDILMKDPVIGTLAGSKKAWGVGVYSPLLALDFYDKKHNLIFGFGLGGYFGSSYPDLEARSGSNLISTGESPIDTLTFHLRTRWGDWRRPSQAEQADDF